MNNSFLENEELKNLGLKSFGKKVLISRYANFYGAQNIEIGDNVRIDDFCILSGKIKLGSHIHIAAGTHMFAGPTGIEVEDFCCLSGSCSVYAITDDYSGNFLSNSTIPNKYKSISGGKILIKKHTLIGASSVLIGGLTIGEGCSFGAMSLINKSTEDWCIYVGQPIRKVKQRSKNLLNLEKEFLQKWRGDYN